MNEVIEDYFISPSPSEFDLRRLNSLQRTKPELTTIHPETELIIIIVPFDGSPATETSGVASTESNTMNRIFIDFAVRKEA